MSADGKCIIPFPLNGTRLVDWRSELEGPVQQRPPAQDWKLWASVLSPLHKGGILIKLLTSWISTPHQQWFWFMDSSRSILFYNPSPNKWYSADPISQRSTRVTRLSSKSRFLRSAMSPINPPDWSTLLRTTIIDDPSQDELSPTPRFATIPTSSPIDAVRQSLKEVLWSHQFYKSLMGPINWSIPISSLQIAKALEENTLLTCCDGSYSPGKSLGSHGWVFAPPKTKLWRGAGPIDGHSRLVSAYRAEIGGFDNILHILLAISQFRGTSVGPVTIYCNCKSTINKLQKMTYGSIN